MSWWWFILEWVTESGLVSNSNTALVLNQILIETSPRCYMLCYSGYVMYILYYAYVILGYVGLFIYAIRLSPLVDFATGVFTSQGHWPPSLTLRKCVVMTNFKLIYVRTLIHWIDTQGRDSQNIGTRLVTFNTFWLYSARLPYNASDP